MSLDKIILQLGVIANVPEHGRLRRDACGGISIEESSSFQPVIRSYNRDSRKKTTDDISALVDATFEKTDDLMNSVYVSVEYDLKPNEEKEKHKVLDNLSRLEIGLKNSLCGLENLKITYTNDKTTSLQISLFYDKIVKKVKEIKHFCSSREIINTN